MKSIVYLARVVDGAEIDVQAEALAAVMAATGFAGQLHKLDMVAIKVHVGEKNNTTQKKGVTDIGVIGSTDIVAVDQATVDLTARAHGANLAEKFYPALDPVTQIEHAEKLKLGSRKYRLEEI